MIGKTERVILVKGDADKWYEQAIFIVNPKAQAAEMPVDFVAEAEKIIGEYNLKRATRRSSSVIIPPVQLQKSTGSKSQPVENKKPKANFALGFLMIVACIIIAAIFTFGLLR